MPPNSIREVHHRVGITQEESAQRVGTWLNTISRLERGKIKLSHDSMQRLSDWLDRGLAKPGKTARGLAQALGIGQLAVSHMRARLRSGGRRRVRVDELQRIAEYIEEPIPAELSQAPQVATAVAEKGKQVRETSMESIAERLRVTRAVLGKLKQKEFCQAAGIAPTAYNHYEQAKRRPSIDHAIRLCEQYHLTLEWIYRGDPSGLTHEWMERLSKALDCAPADLITNVGEPIPVMQLRATEPADRRVGPAAPSGAAAPPSVQTWECHKCGRVYPVTFSGPCVCFEEQRR